VSRCALLVGWCVPVIDHLDSKDGVECEASDESVEDQWIIDFLEGCKDPGKGSSEIVEDLDSKY
jgi:hypothetical protein